MWSMQHGCLEEHRLKVWGAIKQSVEALKDDFKLVESADSLSAQLDEVSNLPAKVDLGSSGNLR